MEEEDEEEQVGGEGEKVKDQSWKEKVERKQKHKNHTECRDTKKQRSCEKHLSVCVDNNSGSCGCMGEGAVNKGTVETSSEQRTVLSCLTDRRY